MDRERESVGTIKDIVHIFWILTPGKRGLYALTWEGIGRVFHWNAVNSQICFLNFLAIHNRNKFPNQGSWLGSFTYCLAPNLWMLYSQIFLPSLLFSVYTLKETSSMEEQKTVKQTADSWGVKSRWGKQVCSRMMLLTNILQAYAWEIQKGNIHQKISLFQIN